MDMDLGTALNSLYLFFLGVLSDQLFWRYRRRIERADASADDALDLLRAVLRPVCDQLGSFAEAHRSEAAKGLPCTGNRRLLVADLDRLFADPTVVWPRNARRGAQELAAAYGQTGDNDAQAAADAAEALRHYLAALLR